MQIAGCFLLTTMIIYNNKNNNNSLRKALAQRVYNFVAWIKATLSCFIPPGGYSWEFLAGVCRPLLQILTRFQTKKCNYPHPFSGQISKIHTRFQTWPLERNYDISTYIIERKQKDSSNPFRICIFLFLSHSFGIETTNTFIRSEIPSKTIPDSRPKWEKCIPVYRPKGRKNPTRWSGTYLYGLYTGVPRPPGMGRS